MGEQIVFGILAIITLVSAFIVVTDSNLFHAAIAMMASFLGVAGFYALLGAGFMAAAQLLVYIGAISILIIFAIMMTRRMMTTTESPFNSQMGLSLIASILFCALLIITIWGARTIPEVGFDTRPAPTLTDGQVLETVPELGRLFVSADGYVLPFELVSVLLLAALVGSIVIARPTADSVETSTVEGLTPEGQTGD